MGSQIILDIPNFTFVMNLNFIGKGKLKELDKEKRKWGDENSSSIGFKYGNEDIQTNIFVRELAVPHALWLKLWYMIYSITLFINYACFHRKSRDRCSLVLLNFLQFKSW